VAERRLLRLDASSTANGVAATRRDRGVRAAAAENVRGSFLVALTDLWWRFALLRSAPL